MKIAAISICMNDSFKTNEWFQHYQQYKQALYKHIIVDNASEKEYIELVKELFCDSIIIHRAQNGGSTAAYNDGIKLALQDPLVDSILLIANDIKLSNNALEVLHKKLYESDKVIMISPVMLCKDSDNLIESYGASIKSGIILKSFDTGSILSESLPLNRIVDIVPGGMSLSKRKLYETVGLQDESLFMYSDEIDMGIRIRKLGYKVSVTREVLCWHQHLNQIGGSRDGFSYFLQARNKLLLGYKHYTIFWVIYTFLTVNCLKIPFVIRRAFIERKLKFILYYLIGSFCGLFNVKKELQCSGFK